MLRPKQPVTGTTRPIFVALCDHPRVGGRPFGIGLGTPAPKQPSRPAAYMGQAPYPELQLFTAPLMALERVLRPFLAVFFRC
jgi:hypothetical protein